MHKSIERLDAQIAKLQADRAAAVRDLQKDCNHESLAECDYKHNEWLASLPPMRVCERCGMSEVGWGPGYIVLRGDRARMVAREALYSMRAGLAIQDEHKGPLLRNETTVTELIDLEHPHD